MECWTLVFQPTESGQHLETSSCNSQVREAVRTSQNSVSCATLATLEKRHTYSTMRAWPIFRLEITRHENDKTPKTYSARRLAIWRNDPVIRLPPAQESAVAPRPATGTRKGEPKNRHPGE